MNLTESFLTAIDSITAHKLRSMLTMLGVIIGVAAVIALMAIGKRRQVRRSQARFRRRHELGLDLAGPLKTAAVMRH